MILYEFAVGHDTGLNKPGRQKACGPIDATDPANLLSHVDKVQNIITSRSIWTKEILLNSVILSQNLNN